LEETVKPSRLGKVLWGLFALASLSHAGLIYSTDGTATPGFNSGPGYGSYAGSNSTAAMFVAASSGLLEDIVVAVSSVDGGTFQENIELRLDNAGVPGTVIDTIAITIPNSQQLVTGLSASHPTLTAGQAYWLEDTVPPTALVGWYLSSPPISGAVRASTGNDGPWQATCPSCSGVLPAFALNSQATEVPEPASSEGILVSMLAMIALRATLRNTTRST
jgi:hypothetical protein